MDPEAELLRLVQKLNAARAIHAELKTEFLQLQMLQARSKRSQLDEGMEKWGLSTLASALALAGLRSSKCSRDGLGPGRVFRAFFWAMAMAVTAGMACAAASPTGRIKRSFSLLDDIRGAFRAGFAASTARSQLEQDSPLSQGLGSVRIEQLQWVHQQRSSLTRN